MSVTKNLRKRGLIVTLAAVALTTVVGGFVYANTRALVVTVARSERGVPVEVFGLGTVEARTVSRIGFEVAGTLVELHGDFGDKVSKGDVLARLYDREQVARVASAKAAASQVNATLAQAKAGLDRARVAMRQKESVSLRREELARRGTSSNETSEDARAAFDIARADAEVAQSAIDVATENLRQATALVEVEAARLAKFVLSAPFDGIIVARQRELGSMLNPGEALFTLVDPQSVWVLAYVDEAKAGQIMVGQPADVVLRSQSGRHYGGRVARIDIESDRVNEERKVYVQCEKCPADFHLGEQAEVTISVAVMSDAILVPASAIAQLQGGKGRVWTLQDGKLSERLVEFGHRTRDGRLEIVGGLNDGANVVVEIVSGMRAGRAARAADLR